MALERNWDPRLDNGDPPLAELVEADAGPGMSYWFLSDARWLDPHASQGRHHIFVDVLDENGNRMVGVPVVMWWDSGQEVKPTEAKPGETYAVDFPIYASGASYGCRMTGMPSDQVIGMGMGTPRERFVGHHTSYLLTFVRKVADKEPPPPTDGERHTVHVEYDRPVNLVVVTNHPINIDVRRE